jgi:hypothetical protein
MQARPRQLDKADALVRRAREIIDYFQPASFFIENPWTGLLPKRDVVRDLPRVRIDYCTMGRYFKKPTCIFTNTDLKESVCPGAERCHAMIGTRRAHTAQMQVSKEYPHDTRIPLQVLYALPPPLCEAMVKAAERQSSNSASRSA